MPAHCFEGAPCWIWSSPSYPIPGRYVKTTKTTLGWVVPATPVEARTHGWLFALADGVGGQERGEVASRTAIESMISGFREALPGEPLPALLTRLVQRANAAVLDAGLTAAPGGVNMATTIVACALRFDRAVLAHAGDSRCYLIRRGHASVLTRDHTLANEHVRLGILSTRESPAVDTRHGCGSHTGH